MDRYQLSRELREQGRAALAGGVHSSMRAGGDPVLFFESAEGCHITDVDGNRYIDYKLGAGPLVLGHSPADVIEAVKAQLDRGLQTATETPLGNEVAEQFVSLVPCAELVHFANTGSEAVHLALRVARAHRNRRRIICFEGHFHGWYDNIWAASEDGPEAAPATLGQGGVLDDLVMLRWNEVETLEAALDAHRDEVAAVIMNPVMLAGAPGGTMPRSGYLERVRELCTQHEALFILDEVLTGFRVALGGAQELFGVQPDLATYAKSISAGLSMAALAGRRDVMEPIATNEVAHPGTYNGNLLCLAAAKAALTHLAADHGAFYRTCNALREQLSDGIREVSARHGVPVQIPGAGAVLTVWFADHADYHDARTARAAHHRDFSVKFFKGLQDRGVLSNPGMFLSDAHTPADIEETVEAADEVVKSLSFNDQRGLCPQPKRIAI